MNRFAKQVVLVGIFVFSGFLAAMAGQPARSDTSRHVTSTYQLAPVVITATKIPQSTRDLSISVSVLPAGEIRMEMAQNLGQIIDEVPGVTSIQFGTLGSVSQSGPAGSKNLSGSKILIRGTNAVTMIDGRPTMMGIFDHPISNALNPYLVSRIEIVRGPASVLYGSNATGGVINLLTPDIRNQKKTSVRFSTGSFRERIFNIQEVYSSDRLGAAVYWNGYGTDSNRETGGYQAHDFFAKVFATPLPDWRIQASVKRYRGFWLDPGPESHPLTNNWFRFTRSGYDFQLKGKSFLGHTELLVYRSDGHHAIYDGYLSDDFTNGAKFSQAFSPWKNNQTVVGFDLRSYGGTDLNRNKSWSVLEWAPYFLTQQMLFSKLIASVGYRLNHHEVYGFKSVPSIGLVFQANNSLSLRANVSQGFRSPSVMQLYLYPPSNTDLTPETSKSFEMGVNYSTRFIQVDVAAYRLKGQNLIQFYFPDKKFRNVGTFDFTGVETSLKLRLTAHINNTLSFTHQDVGSVTGYNPQHKLVNLLTFRNKRVDIGIKSVWVHNLYSENNHREKLPDFFVTDLLGRVHLNRWADVQVALRNITDEAYQMEEGYPMPGRNVELGLQFHMKQ
ncbi:MAG: TonB-dependent receptor [Calditrichaeota bacterium]|nr:TonB-dependent receptor [Calditrichota bacterium]